MHKSDENSCLACVNVSSITRGQYIYKWQMSCWQQEDSLPVVGDEFSLLGEGVLFIRNGNAYDRDHVETVLRPFYSFNKTPQRHTDPFLPRNLVRMDVKVNWPRNKPIGKEGRIKIESTNEKKVSFGLTPALRAYNIFTTFRKCACMESTRLIGTYLLVQALRS
jgi:hypothetical protein